eukprot:4277248-Pyramimonas_sp.AAC.1
MGLDVVVPGDVRVDLLVLRAVAGEECKRSRGGSASCAKDALRPGFALGSWVEPRRGHDLAADGLAVLVVVMSA